MKKRVLTVMAALLGRLSIQSASAILLITQYYEGDGTNKWVEITNVSGSTENLSEYAVGLFSNANTEAYKTNGTPSTSFNLSGSLEVGQSLLLGHPNNQTEVTYGASYTPLLTSSTVINFNGDDSVVLYTVGTFSTASIVDAIGFTDAGSEGANNSIVRISTGPGFNLVAGSTFESFPGVWQEISLASVQNAAPGTEARLGFSSVPEPSSAFLLGAASVGLALVRRRRPGKGA